MAIIHQTELTDLLNPNKFRNCELKQWTGQNKSFLLTSFLGHPVYFSQIKNSLQLMMFSYLDSFTQLAFIQKCTNYDPTFCRLSSIYVLKIVIFIIELLSSLCLILFQILFLRSDFSYPGSEVLKFKNAFHSMSERRREPLVTCNKDSVLLLSNLIDNIVIQFCIKTDFTQLCLWAQELCESAADCKHTVSTTAWNKNT